MNTNREQTKLRIKERLHELLTDGHSIHSVTGRLEHAFPQNKLMIRGIVMEYKKEHGIYQKSKFDTGEDNIEERRRIIDKRITELLDGGMPFKKVLSTVVDEFPQETGLFIQSSFYRYVDKLNLV
ncbi:hypothetical protein P9X10_01025 [Bacillus cereus]|nr:hypothetical protein [Bacillus cereus]